VIGKLPRPVRLLSKTPYPSLAWKEAVGRNKSEGFRAELDDGRWWGHLVWKGKGGTKEKRREEEHVLERSLFVISARKSAYCWWSVDLSLATTKAASRGVAALCYDEFHVDLVSDFV
jgi:hypothetical protein